MEIETTKRTFKLELSDEEVVELYTMAGRMDLMPEQLLEYFIRDLTESIRSNGSDERMMANQWMNRCWFSHEDKSFSAYLIEEGEDEEILKTLDQIEACKQWIAHSEESIKSGVINDDISEDTYTWKNLYRGDGTPRYSSREEWEDHERECIKDWREDIKELERSIDFTWEEYRRWYPDAHSGTMEEEVQKVKVWRESLREALYEQVEEPTEEKEANFENERSEGVEKIKAKEIPVEKALAR